MTQVPFIVFEGLDGAGKSSIIKRLESALVTQGIRHVSTREPGGTHLGEEVRQILLRCEGENPSLKTELLLYEAARAQHVDLVIKPALSSQKWVICDRFTASSLAFQSGGRGIARSEVEWLNHFATSGLTADLTVLLDLDVLESERRRKGREKDRLEKEESDFHQRVRDYYLKLARESKDHWLVLDSKQSPEISFDRLMQALRQKKWL